MCIFGNANERQVKKLRKIADQIELLAPHYASMSDDELRAMTPYFKERLKEGATLDELLPDAYAVVREASSRVLGMRHFYVQLLGGIALHQGRIAEMCTGEGKTLVSTLPAYLNALTGEGMHIVTVNDYLAKRDAEWMGKVHRFLGLTVGVSVEGMSPEEKRAAYQCDILYATNTALGFDYLRDNMVVNRKDLIQRKLNFAIIDEVDSILIDEARTPLIISGGQTGDSDIYKRACAFVRTCRPDDYEIDEEKKTIMLTDRGVDRAQKYFAVDDFADPKNQDLMHHINNSLRAHFILKKDVDYAVMNMEVILIDEATGRLMVGRRFSDGLHQAIEAKEHITIRNESITVATISLQNYFRLYKKISGMTGTAKTEENEFRKIYDLDVVVIPTNLPVKRVDENDIVFRTKEGKIKAIVEHIKECYERKQPILVGTVSVEKSEALSALLKNCRIPHNVLNAKNHEREAEIVAQAGRIGQVTIATNMAGRGTDIMLGGNPEYLARAALEKKGYSHEAIIEAVGFASEISETAMRAREDYKKLYEEYKEQTDKEKEEVLAVGGLRVIGTERHESRRIDNQLRGRSGRQGDVGSSVFFVSFEDDLIRIFGGDRIGGLLRLIPVTDENPISMKAVTGLVAKAQEKVEDRYFAMRKNLLAYDDVINHQREIIYSERNKMLTGEDVHEEIVKMIPSVVEEFLADIIDYSKDYVLWDYDRLNREIETKLLPSGTNVLTKDLASELSFQRIAEAVIDAATAEYEKKKAACEGYGIPFGDFERQVFLRTVDKHWIEHINAMSELRKGIQYRAVGHQDPVVCYANEGFDMFDEMAAAIRRDTVFMVLKKDISVKIVTKAPVESKGAKVGRNDPCPCGSGKKYKHCCGK